MAAAAIVLVTAAGACAGSGDPPGAGPGGSGATGVAGAGGATVGGTAPTGVPVDYSGTGPYPVGTKTIPLEPTRCTPLVDGHFGCPQSAVVYYPADPAAAAGVARIAGYSSAVAYPETVRAVVPPELVQDVRFATDVFDGPTANADGPFPVVLHSHDMGGFDLFESRYLAHLASWGFVVAAPDHQARSVTGQLVKDPYEGDRADIDDLRRTLGALRAANVGDSPLHGAVDPGDLIASGHGVGASVAMKLATDDGFVGYVAKAPTGVPDRVTVDRRGLVIGGDASGHVSLDDLRLTFSKLGPRARLVVLHDVGHNSFTDLCGPMWAKGGLTQHAERLANIAELLRTSEDGCTPAHADPADVEAITDHLAVAHVRWILGLDRSDVSLSADWLAARFPRVFGSSSLGA